MSDPMKDTKTKDESKSTPNSNNSDKKRRLYSIRSNRYGDI